MQAYASFSIVAEFRYDAKADQFLLNRPAAAEQQPAPEKAPAPVQAPAPKK